MIDSFKVQKLTVKIYLDDNPEILIEDLATAKRLIRGE